MNDKIFTGNDKAREMGYGSLCEMIHALAQKRGWKLGDKLSRSAVYGRVDFGRWLADCECGGAGYVEPDDPIFFCMDCGNANQHGVLRPVVFPENRAEIEAELLQRSVNVNAKLSPVAAAMNAKSSLPGLSRSWNPGETVETLRMQRDAYGV